jgi:DNA-binding PadR family transcriptional regulator
MVETTNTPTHLMDDEGIQRWVLHTLDKESEIKDSLILSKYLGIAHSELDKNLKSLSADDYVTLDVLERKIVELSEEGKTYVDKGTPEYQYTTALEMNKPSPKSEVEAKVGAEVAKIGFSKAM